MKHCEHNGAIVVHTGDCPLCAIQKKVVELEKGNQVLRNYSKAYHDLVYSFSDRARGFKSFVEFLDETQQGINKIEADNQARRVAIGEQWKADEQCDEPEDDRDQCRFDDESTGCACFINAPCSYCMNNCPDCESQTCLDCRGCDCEHNKNRCRE